jgi:hypothetical protein
MIGFLDALTTYSNATPSLYDKGSDISNILGMDQYLWDEDNFNKAAINPASFLEMRKKAIKDLSAEVDEEYHSYFDKKNKLYVHRGAKLEGMPRKQILEIAKQAALSLYATRMNIINLKFPVKFVEKSKERILKANTSTEKGQYKSDDLNMTMDYSKFGKEEQISLNKIVEKKQED